MKKKFLTIITVLIILTSTFMMFNLTTFAASAASANLKLYISPNSILADNSAYSCVFVQLVDANGVPTRAAQNTTIDLSSNMPGVGTVDQTTTILQNDTYATANFTSTYNPGTTTITATAPNYATVTAAVTTIGPYTLTTKPADLKIYISPNSILADNSTNRCIFVQLIDANGVPNRAETDTKIDLSTSAPGIGTVDQTTSIPQNATYTSASFTSTYLAGTTTITATAPNLAAVSASITTINPDALTTKPSDLKIYISPNNILADNSTNRCIFVQLIDASGVPTRAEQNTTITLSSSTPGIGTVDQTIVISKYSTYASANFSSTYLPGSTKITATAPNYQTVEATLSTIGPYPYKTAVYGLPSTLPANGGTYPAVMVQLQDFNGLPARAPNDVYVSLFSSDEGFGSVTSSITILQGQTFAIANFISTMQPGQTKITAVGHGYISTQTAFNTITLTLSPPKQLRVLEGAPYLPADNTVYRQIIVELQDSFGYPTTSSSDTRVTIASSDNTTATTNDEITIPADSTYALANLNTTYRPGAVTITAARNGLETSQHVFTTIGYTPSKLVVFCAPSNLPSDNSTYTAVQVQLQDDQGRPARNPDSGTILKLFSSDLTVGDVCPSITIPLGQTQATGSFTLTSKHGVTTITAMGSNYTTGQTTLTTHGVTPKKLGVYCTPSILPADNQTYQVIQVQLQDGQGNPAKNTDANTVVRLFTSNTVVGSVNPEITIPMGQTQATASFTLTNIAGVTTITAISSNYTTGQATLTTYGFTPTRLAVYCTPSSLPADNSTYQAITVQLQDDSGNPATNPVSNTTVRLFTSNIGVGVVTSEITIPLGQTQATGNFTFTNTPGTTTITAMDSNYTTGHATLTSYFIDYLPTQVLVSANPDTIYGGNTTQISAYLVGNGAPLTGAHVTFTSNNNGIFSAISEGNGFYNATFTAPNISQITVCNITVNATKAGWLNSSGITFVTVNPTPPQPSPTATPSPTPSPSASPTANPLTETPTSNSTSNGATIQLCIKDINDNPLSDASVSSVTQPAGAQILFAVTNATGYVTFENVKAGSYTFKIVKDGYSQIDQTVNCTTTEQPLPTTINLLNSNISNPANNTLIIAAIVIAVVIAGVVGGLVFVRRRWDIKLTKT